MCIRPRILRINEYLLIASIRPRILRIDEDLLIAISKYSSIRKIRGLILAIGKKIKFALRNPLLPCQGFPFS